MDKRVRNAIAKIEVVGGDGKSKSRGTGFLVADDKVITALHVVANRNSNPLQPIAGQIKLSFPGHETPAKIATELFDNKEDWVLLDCQTPPPVQPIPLGVRHDSGSSFETFGFPDANPRDGMVQTGTIEDDGANLDGIPAYQLFSRQAAAGNGSPAKGLSGAPVIIDGAVVGLLRFALMDQQRQTVAGTLYACPLASVIQQVGDVLPVPDPLHGLPGVPRQPLPASPFRYLEHFTEKDAEIFFGRSREIADLYRLLISEDGPAIVLFYGQSGVGKSSFLDAGVVPRLRWEYEPIYLRRNEGSTLLDTIRAALSPPAKSLSLADGWRWQEQKLGKPLILILDQVEEIYTRPVAGQQDELGELCSAIADSIDSDHELRSRLLLSFRKEWYPEIHKQFELRNLGHGNVFLEGLSREGVLDVLNGLSRNQRLVQQYRLSVEPGLAELIAGDLVTDSDSPIAPTLQVLLTKMWREASKIAPHGPEFTIELYQQLKHEGLLLGDFLEQQLAAMHAIDATDIDSGLALDLLDFHTTHKSTACERHHDELLRAYRHVENRLDPLLGKMVDHYLLAQHAETGDGAAMSTRLSHDTLAPLVGSLVTRSEQPGQRARRILENRNKEWQEGKDGVPLDMRDLEVAELGLKGTQATTADEDRMLTASRRLRSRHRRNRRSQIGLGVVAVAAVVTAGLWGLWENNRAKQQEVVAKNQQVLAELSRSTDQMFNLLPVEPVHALMISVAAAGKSYEDLGKVLPALQFSLNQAVNHSWETTLIDNKAPVTSVVMEPGGKRFASADEDGRVKIWAVPDVKNASNQGGIPKPIVTFEAHEGKSVNAVAFAAESFILATASSDGTVRLWDGQGRPVGPAFTGHDGPVLSIVFGPKDQLISSGEDGTIRRWTRDGKPIGPLLAAHSGYPVTTLAVDIKRDVLISGAADHSIRIWSLVSGEPIAKILEAHKGPVEDLAISPADNVFASAGHDGVIRLWDLNGSSRGQPMDLKSATTALAFRTDGRAIVSGSEDFLVHIIEVSREDGIGQLLAPPFKGIDNVVTAIALSPGDSQIIVSSLDGTIRVGDWMSSQVVLPRRTDFIPSQVSVDNKLGNITVAGMKGNKPHWQHWANNIKPTGGAVDTHPDQKLEQVVISRDGDNMAGIYASKDVLLHNLQKRNSQTVELQGIGRIGRVTTLEFGRNGAILAVAAERGIVLLNTANGETLTTIEISGDPVTQLVFSHDGNTIVGVSNDCVSLWDLEESKTPSNSILYVRTSDFPICASGKDSLSVVAVDHKGDHLAVGDDAGNLKLWHRDGKKIDRIKSFKGHNGKITVLAFRPDVRALISGATGDRLKLWNLLGQRLAEFTVKDAKFLDVVFDEKGRTAVSSGADKEVRIWATHWREWLRIGCKRLNNHVSFTQPETNQGETAKIWADEARRVCGELRPTLVGDGL